jgi:hypothetical protein
MTIDEIQIPLFRAARGSNWAERHGWWILSLCFHVILFVLLAIRADILPSGSTAETPTIRILFQPAGLRPAPVESPETAESSPSPPEAVRTIGDALEAMNRLAAAITFPRTTEDAPKPGAETAPRSELDEQERKIQEILRRQAVGEGRAKEPAEASRLQVDSRLLRFEVLDKAADFLDGAATTETGPIRTVNFGDVDAEIVKRVFERYGIRITHGYTEPAENRYLSAVKKDGLTFSAVERPGEYDMLVIPARAQTKMMALEQNWLVSHGYNTRVTQVESVEFGIVRVGDGWDLGILEIKVRDLGREGWK